MNVKCHWCQKELIECEGYWSNFECPDVHCSVLINKNDEITHYILFVDVGEERYRLVGHNNHDGREYTTIEKKVYNSAFSSRTSMSFKYTAIVTIDQFVPLIFVDTVIQGYKMFQKINKLKAFA